jgi:hypothetical protein
VRVEKKRIHIDAQDGQDEEKDFNNGSLFAEVSVHG